MGFPYDATGIDPNLKRKVAPEGTYRLQIVDVSEEKDSAPRVTKNGDRYVMVECEIADQGPGFGVKIWHNVTFLGNGKPGAGMAIHFLKQIGQPFEGQIEVEPQDWIGALFMAKIRIGKDNKGQDRNEIGFIVSEETVLNKDEESVPF